jgi:23S rRNA (cytosine1962-C5)-methyltransferase
MNYELIDSGEGRRLEKFGDYLLDRPDPEVLWKKSLTDEDWDKSDATFNGNWKNKKNVPEKWQMEENGIKFWAKLAPFKHTGVFPEQVEQWHYITEEIKKSRTQEPNVLNLFAYTGIASLFAAKAGAKVTHVDASKPATTWANENRELNGMHDAPIRWIIDDVIKFTDRQIKRGIKYDAIVMDPPVYGHGPNGTIWDFNKDFPKLLKNCKELLSEKPIFVLVNAYAISTSSITLGNTLSDYLNNLNGKIDTGELTIKQKNSSRLLSTGIWARWQKS